ncbi:putative leucine-rich repeat domain superfamily [Dioscorea sansibarensis]
MVNNGWTPSFCVTQTLEDCRLLEILNGELLRILINLQELQFINCRALVSFPNEMEEGLHCLVSLKRLFIDRCRRLRSLPCGLATIPSLEESCITDCNYIQ